jgi:hypothetical protein
MSIQQESVKGTDWIFKIIENTNLGVHESNRTFRRKFNDNYAKEHKIAVVISVNKLITSIIYMFRELPLLAQS